LRTAGERIPSQFLIGTYCYGIFTSGVYKATAPQAASAQEKPHFVAMPCAVEVKML
jgi:hypothetical protein